MKTRRVLLIGVAVSVMGTLPAIAGTIPYTFQEASYPGDTFTQLLGINKSGVIAGYHGEDPNKGFILSLPQTFTDENYPNSAQTQVVGINNAGDTAGFYVDGNDVVSGFTRIKGVFAVANAPGTQFNQILGINNVGELAGYSSTDPGGETLQQAFVRLSNGAYRYLAMPAGTTNSQATGINDSHTVCGFYVDPDDNNHGFIYSNGVLSRLDYPGSAFTQALGINNWGQVVGQYQDGFGGMHGFVYTNGAFQSVDEPEAQPGTTLVNGINDLGQIVGFYTDADDNTVGFVGMPQGAAETAIFRAILAPTPGLQATGTVDVIAHLVQDGTGQVISGTVDFWARPNFAAAGTVNGLSIQSGSSANGVPLINSTINFLSPQTAKAGGDLIKSSGQVKGDIPATLTALRGLMQNPGQYYVSLSTPNGSMMGQLQAAQWVVLMGVMDPNNEVPPATNSKATGVAQAIAIGTRGANGAWTSGEVYLTTTYANQKDPAAFTGFHIHLGSAGAAGPVVIPAPLPTGLAPDPSGSGTVGPMAIEISLSNAQQVTAFSDLFTNPGATYVNIHNTTYPGGFMRAQLRTTDSMTFPFVLDSANELTMPTVNATGPGTMSLYTLRNEDGSVAAVTAVVDVNYRLPAATSITGLALQNGAATASDVAIPAIPIVPTAAQPAFNTDSGFGNFFGWTPPTVAGSSLNDTVMNPENHYINLTTSSDPKGAMRAQLAPPVGGAMIQAVISSDMDANATTVAPGELISIFGANLSKVQTSLSGWQGKTLPWSLNGATVDIGGQRAPLIYISPEQINAQVPLNIAAGKQMVVVNNGSGPSDAFEITVGDVAPAIFNDPVAAIVKVADYSLVTDDNPTHAGEIVVVYWTGGGQTTPALSTGVLVPVGMLANTMPITATVGGLPAKLVSSVASPEFVGLYQTAIMIPAGVTGTASLTLQLEDVMSNTVNVVVR